MTTETVQVNTRHPTEFVRALDYLLLLTGVSRSRAVEDLFRGSMMSLVQAAVRRGVVTESEYHEAFATNRTGDWRGVFGGLGDLLELVFSRNPMFAVEMVNESIAAASAAWEAEPVETVADECKGTVVVGSVAGRIVAMTPNTETGVTPDTEE